MRGPARGYFHQLKRVAKVSHVSLHLLGQKGLTGFDGKSLFPTKCAIAAHYSSTRGLIWFDSLGNSLIRPMGPIRAFLRVPAICSHSRIAGPLYYGASHFRRQALRASLFSTNHQPLSTSHSFHAFIIPPFPVLSRTHLLNRSGACWA